MNGFRSVRKIVVIKLRHIGDVLLTVPVFRALRETFPGAHITALVNSGTEEALAGNPLVDEIIEFDRRIKTESMLKKISLETSFLSGIRAGKFDMAVDLTSGDRAALISLVSGARYRLAYDPGGGGFPGKKLAYSHIARRSNPSPHMVLQNLEMVAQFGITTGNTAVDINIPGDAEEFAERIFGEYPLSGCNRIAHVHPTSRWLFKCWKDEYMARVIDWLAGHGAGIIVTSSPSDTEMRRAGKVLDGIKEKDRIVDLCGKTTIKQLAAVSARSDLFVGVDSAPMHIAAAVGVPVIALFGPTGDEHWGPWGEGHVILREKMGDDLCAACRKDRPEVRPCLEAIKPQEVLSAIRQKLDIADDNGIVGG